jgi:hypothetical protein
VEDFNEKPEKQGSDSEKNERTGKNIMAAPSEKELTDMLLSTQSAPSVASETDAISLTADVPVLADGATTEDGAALEEDATLSVSDVAIQAIANLKPSAQKFGSDILQTVLHPIDTAENIVDLGKGVYQLMTPGEQPEEAKARAVGQFFADRYGGWENFKKTIATDPVGFLSDMSVVLSGGGTLAARVPAAAGTVASIVQSAGKGAQALGRAIDPVNVVGKTATAVGSKVAAPVAGALTGVGGDAFIIANEAARAGGAKAKAFLDNMRGRVPVGNTLDLAKDALLELKQARQTAYLNGMLPIKSSNKTLKFDDIDTAMGNLSTSGSYKGIAIRGSKPQEIFQAIQTKIDEFKNLGPENHRAVDFDQMKQAIGEIRDGINVVDNPAAYNLANTIYGKIRKTIGDQDQSYFKVMKEYMEASDLITDMEKTFALKGRKTNVDTALRKLQSIMRNNVNTSYGRRVELGGQLAGTTAGQTLLPSLAGQALQPWTSRGIGIPSKMMLGAAAGTQSVAPLLGYPLTMPRVMGEAAYAASKYGGAGGRRVRQGAPAAFQAGRAERVAAEGQGTDAQALARALQRSMPARSR